MYKTEFVDRFSLLRDISRQMFVKGYLPPEEYAGLPASTFSDRKKRLYNYLQDNLLFNFSGKSRNNWITLSEARQTVNPFYRLFKIKKTLPSDVAFHFSLISNQNTALKESTREDLFGTYNHKLGYEDSSIGEAWRIVNISVDGCRIDGESPVKTLKQLIGADNYHRMLDEAKQKISQNLEIPICFQKVSFSDGQTAQVLAFRNTFVCYMNGRELTSEEFRELWCRDAASQTYPFERLSADIKDHTRSCLLGKATDKNTEHPVYIFLYDQHTLLLLPLNRKLSFPKDCRRYFSENQIDKLAQRQSDLLHRINETEATGCINGHEVLFTVRKSSAHSSTAHITGSNMQVTSFNQSLEAYCRLGILNKEKHNAYLYSFSMRPFSKNCIRSDGKDGLFDRFPGLKNAVVFFSEVLPLGVIGNQIMDTCYLQNELFSYRDRYVSQALDSIVLYELLEAIQSHQIVQLFAEKTAEYLPVRRSAQPIAIVSDAQTGRQYVYAWDISKEVYFFFRLDLIRRIEQRKEYAWCESVHTNGMAQLDHVWSNRLWDGRLRTIDVEITFDPDTEPFIRQRVFRECRNAHVLEPAPGLLHISAQVYDPLELMPWLLSFTGRIQRISAPFSMAARRFHTHIEGMHSLYFGTAGNDEPGIGHGRAYKLAEDGPSAGKRFTKVPATDSPLFQGISNSYIVAYDYILRKMGELGTDEEPYKCNRDSLVALIKESVEKYAYRETLEHITPESMVADRLVRCRNGEYSSCFDFLTYRPFTACETRWIKTIAMDPRMHLFLSKEEIQELQNELAVCISPLYDENTLRTVGACNDADDTLSPVYQKHFRQLTCAIQAGEELEITFTAAASNTKKTVTLWPLRLEYSGMRRKFSLYGMSSKGLVWIIRLSTIHQVRPANLHSVRPENITWKNCIDAMTVADDAVLEVLVSTEANALERFMLEFQTYRKTSEYNSETKQCLVKIWYLKADYAEMISKLLRFGKTVEVKGPVFIRQKIKDRILRQYQLLQNSPE